ncbi:hypothetical protein TNCT_666191 [Trichonephila clavata]|uniref:Uncharacterized protein n=1 Tax=Trichonephila clavata TaxID=2740835 RepID=A0A8X6KXT8_TRICU|nr:hypothetical protein TNCT_666191 [Trichonephila clavata]
MSCLLFNCENRQHLNVTFENNWITHSGLAHWPTKSLDLSSMDFYWGHMKSLAHEISVESVKDLGQECGEPKARVPLMACSKTL